MILNKKELVENRNFFIVIITLLVVLISLSLIVKNKENNIKEDALSSNGEEKYYKLVINEYMSTSSSLVDEDGNTNDWIELYNGSDHDINLKNYGLSDQENKIKWVFPDVIIEAKSYLVVYLSGEDDKYMHASFKLKSSGNETIALIKPNGKIIDAVSTIAIDKGYSVARSLDGNFIITNMPTPNYSNTLEGYNNLYNDKLLDKSGIRINEVLPKNSGNFILNDKFYGYVEIINEGDSLVNLNNYYLSDDLNVLYKYRLENIMLKPGEVVVIYMGIGNDNNYYSSFNLESKNGSIYLSNNFGIVDSITYEDLPNGFAYMKIEEDYYKTSVISPGYLNNNEGVLEFSKKYLNKNKNLLINEVMNNNSLYLAQNGYQFYDWIELYNNSDTDINLSEYYLTTTSNNTTMFRLPNVTLKPNSYYVIMASGDVNLSNKSYNHTNFKIGDVESIYLYKSNKIVDSVMISNIPANYSYGRDEYGFSYSTPTPLKKNKIGNKEISYTPTFDYESGIYNDIENVILKLDAVGDIYYTLDGTNPTKNSKKYNNEIVLNKTSVVKAASFEKGKLKSEVVTNSYIINENHTLPVVSMSIENKDYNKIVSNPNDYIEVSGYLEFYEDEGSFSIPCSISLFGGSARFLNKKSYAIRFKSEYGASELVYNLFDNRDTSVYQSLVLRSGSQDYEHAFIRDILGTSLVDDYTLIDTQSYKPSILYINGKYYGIYNIREKINDDFIANHYNVDPSKLNLIQGNGEVKNGTKDFYNKVVNFVKTNNMALAENYEKIKEMVDIENFIDFFIAELYSTNNDIINVRYFSHPDIDNGKMKMILFDLDYAFYNHTHNYYYFLTNPDGMNNTFHVDNTILINLFKNEQFKKDFLSRLSYNMNATWDMDNILNRFNEIYNILSPEMERNQKRWNLTLTNWNNELDFLKNYILKREKYLLNHTKSYFKLTNEEFNNYFGSEV